MSFKIIETELPKIIYDNYIHILKCIENNIPIKRTIRREIYINGPLMKYTNIKIRKDAHLYVL